jgi:hypothetical protein
MFDGGVDGGLRALEDGRVVWFYSDGEGVGRHFVSWIPRSAKDFACRREREEFGFILSIIFEAFTLFLFIWGFSLLQFCVLGCITSRQETGLDL